jgi:hypothetical protein
VVSVSMMPQQPPLSPQQDTGAPEPNDPPKEAADEMPLPSNPQTFFLGSLITLAVLAAIYTPPFRFAAISALSFGCKADFSSRSAMTSAGRLNARSSSALACIALILFDLAPDLFALSHTAAQSAAGEQVK